VLLTAGVGLLLALALTLVSWGMSPSKRSMLGPPRDVLLVACVLAAPTLALVALAAAACSPVPATEDVSWRIHLACGGLTMLEGILPLVVLLMPRLGSDPVHPTVTGAALGMTAGSWTAMMAYLRCPHAAAFHCIFAHVLPTIAFMAVGAILGRAFLKIR
jgi:hypothetical protein